MWDCFRLAELFELQENTIEAEKYHLETENLLEQIKCNLLEST
ncbi:hypothetical protein YTPLAS73_13640 [Nitrosarchaeum sp.]|nr:hypothetical protein YTPLAS73_13640 [Nitrosarchaeum sp.]